MDFDTYKPIQILFIQDVFIEDCLKDEFVEHIEKEPEIVYDNIPLIFYDKETWIKSTNLLCWHCSLKFSCVPVFIPNNIEPSKSGISMQVLGNFCSFECAKAFIDTEFHQIEKINKKNMLEMLYNILIDDGDFHNVDLAPKKHKMMQFGGNMHHNTYKNLLTHRVAHSADM